MKTDLYTKGVLSVIAVALVALVIQNIKPVNEAQAGPVNFNSFASVPINEDGSINVRMTSDMDVNIHSIGGSSVYGALPVNLKEISGSSLSSNGIPVNIEAVDGMNVYSAIPVKEVK
ncbi:MAG: hypothetical protein JWO09_1237 [Bacteroidetes bacterium]|nr:hypothetical protein [Bacteroidota bacterium]